MAHNINYANGQYNMFSVKERPWHGLGKVLDFPPTSEEAIKLAGLDYEVGLAPLRTTINGNDQIVPKRFMTYRTDTGDQFDIVSNIYKVVQNRDAFTFFDSIVGKKEAIYETAGCLGKGEIVFITAKLPSYIKVANKDDIEKYLLLAMGHDGHISILAMFTPIRVVCNNTLNAALNGKDVRINIKHTTDVIERLKTAHKILGITSKLSDDLSVILNKMAKVTLTDKQFETNLNLVLLTPEELQKLALTGNHADAEVSTQKIKMFNNIIEYSHVGVGQDMDHCKGTVYGFYNAVTGYFQNVKNFHSEDRKMISNLLGTNYNVMQKAFDISHSLAF